MKMSEEKRRLIRAFGAELVLAPTELPFDHPDNYIEVAKRIAHNEDAHGVNGPTWKAVLELLTLAKEIVGLVGWPHVAIGTSAIAVAGSALASASTSRRSRVPNLSTSFALKDAGCDILEEGRHFGRHLRIPRRKRICIGVEVVQYDVTHHVITVSDRHGVVVLAQMPLSSKIRVVSCLLEY